MTSTPRTETEDQKPSAHDCPARTNAILSYFLAAFSVLLVWQMLKVRGLCGDEFIWDKIGKQWCAGTAPYTGLFENKNPGIFYIHFLSNFFFGGSPYLGRIAGMILQLGAALLVYDITSGILSASQRLWCLAAFIVLTLVPSTDPIMVAATESFMYPFTVLGFWLYLRLPRQNKPQQSSSLVPAFLAGTAVGAAIVFKQIALPSLLALMCWPVFSKPFSHGWRESLAMLAGAVTLNAAAVTPILLSGATFQQYFQMAWVSLFGIGRFSAIGRSYSINWVVWAEWILPMMLFCLVLARKRAAWPFLLWLCADFAGVNGSGDYYSHQFKQLIPSLAICGGWALSDIFKTYPENKRDFAIVALMTGFFLISALDNIVERSWRGWSDAVYKHLCQEDITRRFLYCPDRATIQVP